MKIIKQLHSIFLFIVLAVCAVNPAIAERTTTYFHSDGVGSIVAASDENGDLLWRKQYQPFGTQIEGSNISESTSFTGKQHDDTTGLTYFGARYYDPMLARFVSTDPVSPLAAVGGSPYFFNRYAYANNNPYRYLDPDGQAAFLVPIIIFLAKEGTAEIASRYTNGATDFLSFRRLGTKSVKLGIRTYKDKTGKLSDTTKKKTDDGGASKKKAEDSGDQASDSSEATKGADNLPVPFDGANATKQLLGTTKTPGGRDINFHAADRMVNPPRGRSQMSPADVDAVLDGATNIRKRSFHPQGNTLTIQNRNLPGKPQVVVDEATGNRVITVINPK